MSSSSATQPPPFSGWVVTEMMRSLPYSIVIDAGRPASGVKAPPVEG